MDKCKYYLTLDGVTKVFNSDLELSEFVKHNIDDADTKNLRIMYSKTEPGEKTKQEEIIDRIKEGIDPYSRQYLLSEDFLKEKHIIDGSLELLAPYFEDKNFVEKGAEYILENNIELKELAKTDPERAKKEAIDIITNDLELDHKMMNLSIITSDNMKGLINKNRRFNINEILEGIASYNLNTSDKEAIANYISEIPKAEKDRLEQQFDSWYNKISSSQDLYRANINLSKALKIGDFSGISSWLSYISVSPEGIPSIYEIKVSRDPFKKWHSAKKATTDYKLGINRQLLSSLTPTSESSLFIQPVIFPTDANNKIIIRDIYIDNVIDRSRRDANAGLDIGGKVTDRIRKVLPADVIENFDESNKMDDINKETLELFFGKYNFRTKVTSLNAENKYKQILTQSKDQPKLVIYDGIEHKKLEEDNTPEGRIKFKEVVEDYYKRASEAKHTQMIDLQKAILSAKKGTYDSILDKEIKFGRSSSELQKTFSKYLSEDWQLVVGRPELINGGLLLFRNVANNTVEAVSLTVNELDQVNDLGVGTTILGKYRTNESVRGDKKLLDASNANIEIIKALTILNNNPDLISGYTLNGIKVFNSLENKGDYVNINTAIYNFDLLLNESKKYKDIPNYFTGKDSKIKITEFGKMLYSEILKQAETLSLKTFRADVDQIGDIDEFNDAKAKLNKFLKLRDVLNEEFRQLNTNDQTKVQDFSNPIEYMNYLVSAGITYYSGIDSMFDYDIPRYGLRIGDMTHWLRTLMFGGAPDYDKKGNKIVGLFQGSHFSTADAMQSVYMSKLHELITIASNKLRSDYNKRKSIIIGSTNEYYKEINRSDLGKILIGNADKYHEVFYESFNGKMTNDFIVKNPWDMNASLNDPQRKYLKNFIYNQYISRNDSNLELDTFEKFEKSDALKDLLKSDNKDEFDLLRKVPLIKKQSLSKYKSLTTGEFRKFIGQEWDSFKSGIDPRNLTGEERDEERQKAGFYQSVNGFRKMYNQFDYQESEENRHGLIEKYGIDYFEVNLDTIALKYAFETIREKQFNAILPIIYSAITVMKYHGWQTGRTPEVEKAIEDFFNQAKVSMYDVSIVKGKETEEALSLVKKIQHITSLMTIALRPTMMVKELVVGTIKNASYAWSKVYGHNTFEAKDLTKAYKLFFNGQEDFNKIMELNNEYAIANRDLNEMVSKTKVDRYGLNFMSNAMYWCNTFPDYINRLSLFLAKMVKDGTYDAHSINDKGQLVYDPTKDDRYSYYFKMRDKYGFEMQKSDSKYNEQRNNYLYAIEDFNSTLYALNEKPLTEKDHIPQAYSSKERGNIKTFADTAYGYYDKELSPLEKFLPTGIIFGQFLTFWPSKIKYYFGKEGSKAARQYRTQKYTQDADSNKTFYFVKWTTDKEGNLYKEEVPESQLEKDDPRIEASEWRGELNEGLMYSLAHVIRDLGTGSFDETDPQRLQQAKLMLHDLLLMMSSLILGSLLYSDLKKSKTDADKYDQYQRLATKIMYKSTNEFDPFSNTIGSLQATPAFISTLANTQKDITKMLSGHEDLAKFLHRNIQSMELLPNPMTKN